MPSDSRPGTCVAPIVLVVEDDLAAREACADALDDAGYHVMRAANGLDALKLMALVRPSVVVLDLMMPIMSGAELLAVMRADLRLRSIPTVVTSAYTDRVRSQRSVILPKPYSGTQLLEAIRCCATDA